MLIFSPQNWPLPFNRLNFHSMKDYQLIEEGGGWKEKPYTQVANLSFILQGDRENDNMLPSRCHACPQMTYHCSAGQSRQRKNR